MSQKNEEERQRGRHLALTFDLHAWVWAFTHASVLGRGQHVRAEVSVPEGGGEGGRSGPVLSFKCSTSSRELHPGDHALTLHLWRHLGF